MLVKLISLTKPCFQIDGRDITPEELMVFVARVSSPKNQENVETSSKLLKYCLKKKHFSIFEQVSMTVEVVTSRAVSAQILRHRSMVFQEFSQRYSEVTTFEQYDGRKQDTKNRQNSTNDLSPEDKDWFNNAQTEIQELALRLYKSSLDRGIAKESARFLLPISATTRLYMTGNIRDWIFYLNTRAYGEGVQQEHREIALEIAKIFKDIFPNIFIACQEAMGWV